MNIPLILRVIFGVIWVLFALPTLGATDDAANKANIEAGKILSAKCVACHGADGNTTVGNWPKLAGQHKNYLIAQMKEFQKGPQGNRDNAIMYANVSQLTDQEIEQLSAYYTSLPVVYGEAKPELLELGQQLYRGGDAQKSIPACSACHGPAGQGIASAKYPALAGQNAEYTVEALKNYKEGKRKTNSGIMRAVASKMTEQEMLAVASYISGLQPNKP